MSKKSVLYFIVMAVVLIAMYVSYAVYQEIQKTNSEDPLVSET